MDEGTSAISGGLSGATNTVFLPQNRSHTQAYWYKTGAFMNVLIIIGSLIVSLLILIPLLERYQESLGLHKMQKYSKYILPLVMVSLVIKLIYMLWHGG